MSELLLRDGFTVHAVDASATMIASFRDRFPDVQAECNAVEESDFFGRSFDGVIAWGLIFLLSPATQRLLIGKIARALNTGGKFIFTSPKQECTWPDAITGLRSISLGYETYREALMAEGLVLVGEDLDEGQNHYYSASKI